LADAEFLQRIDALGNAVLRARGVWARGFGHSVLGGRRRWRILRGKTHLVRARRTSGETSACSGWRRRAATAAFRASLISSSV
jgi:hypothetical protein